MVPAGHAAQVIPPWTGTVDPVQSEDFRQNPAEYEKTDEVPNDTVYGRELDV